eukprot:4661990-Prymnesium_polylepis.1
MWLVGAVKCAGSRGSSHMVRVAASRVTCLVGAVWRGLAKDVLRRGGTHAPMAARELAEQLRNRQSAGAR